MGVNRTFVQITQFLLRDKLMSLYMVPEGHELSSPWKQSEPSLLSPVTKQEFRHEKTYPKAKLCREIITAACHKPPGITTFGSTSAIFAKLADAKVSEKEPKDEK